MDKINCRCLGSSLFRGSSASNNEYFEMFLLLNSFKYSSSQLYSQETDLISLAFPCKGKIKNTPAVLPRNLLDPHSLSHI